MAGTQPAKDKDVVKISVDIQPRQGVGWNLIPEYKATYTIRETVASLEGWLDHKGIFIRDGVVAGDNIGGVDVRRGHRIVKTKGEPGCDGDRYLDVGTPWTREEFVKKAQELEHPFAGAAVVSEHLHEAMVHCLVDGAEDLEIFRLKSFDYWEHRATQLEEEEIMLHEGAHTEIKPCLKDKKVFLLQEMAEASGFANPNLLGYMLVNGCPVFGEFPRWGSFKEKITKATQPLQKVLLSAKWVKHAIMGRVQPGQDPELDQEVLRQTDAEVSAGKAAGPFTIEEMDAQLGTFWVPAPRVGLRQGDSVRPIDDFSIYGHNATSQTAESPVSGGVDEIAAVVKTMASAVATGWVAEHPGAGGGDWHRVHPGYAGSTQGAVVGRTLDLEKAYKNLAPAPAFSPLMVIAI